MWLEGATTPYLPLETQAALEEQFVDILLPPQLLSVLGSAPADFPSSY